MEAWVVANGQHQLSSTFGLVPWHASNLLYPLFEEKETVPISKGRAFIRENSLKLVLI
jgi:hypothetical protein